MTEDTANRPEATRPVEYVRSPLFSSASVVVGLIVILLFAALLLPATRSVREPARRNACMNNLKQIAIALSNYETARGMLPPAYTVDEQGRRLHSWRTLILPFMEHATLYKSIDLSKPWDDPVNAKARNTVMDVYTCPSALPKAGLTTYLAVTGEHCAFRGAEPRKLDEVTDGPAQTIAVVDVPEDNAVHWMSPEDIDVEVLAAYDAETKSQHGSVRLAAFLDGHVQPLSKEISDDAVRALATIDAGEDLSEWSE